MPHTVTVWLGVSPSCSTPSQSGLGFSLVPHTVTVWFGVFPLCPTPLSGLGFPPCCVPHHHDLIPNELALFSSRDERYLSTLNVGPKRSEHELLSVVIPFLGSFDREIEIEKRDVACSEEEDSHDVEAGWCPLRSGAAYCGRLVTCNCV